MTDFSSEHESKASTGADQDDASADPSRVDRRGFLRALSGSALTLVAGGLTVTLAACNGAPGGNTIYSSSDVGLNFAPSTSSTFTSSSSGFPSTIGNSSTSSGSSTSSTTGGTSSTASTPSTPSASGSARRGFNTRF